MPHKNRATKHIIAEFIPSQCGWFVFEGSSFTPLMEILERWDEDDFAAREVYNVFTSECFHYALLDTGSVSYKCRLINSNRLDIFATLYA